MTERHSEKFVPVSTLDKQTPKREDSRKTECQVCMNGSVHPLRECPTLREAPRPQAYKR